MNFISKITRDKTFFILLLIVVFLGIYVRFADFSHIGYASDDEATLPAGLMWFYPHSYFPGLNYGNPPLGDMISGAGCMLSGEDFSGVSNIRPFFYPDRYLWIGEGLANSNFQCHLPGLIFGVIFLLIIIYFALTFFNKYSALFLISFFSFSPLIIKYTRIIKPDIFLWVFTLLSLIFFLKAYKEYKFSKKELIYFLISAAFLGLTLATKFSIVFLPIVYFFLLLRKYSKEILQILSLITRKLNLTFLRDLEIDKSACLKFTRLLALFGIVSTFFTLIFFKLNPKNFYETYTIYQRFNQNLASSNFNLNSFFRYSQEILLNLNLIDTLFFFFAFYLYYKLVRKGEKSSVDYLILYLAPVGFIVTIFFPVFLGFYRTLPYFIGFIFLMSLAFSSISPLWKLKNRRLIFILVLIIYISFSFYNVNSTSPNFENKNPLICAIWEDKCNIYQTAIKPTADYLNSILKDDETFIGFEGPLLFHLRHSQGILDWNFHQAFKQQVGREPTMSEKIQFFRPENQTVRYLVFDPSPRQRFGEESAIFMQTFQPNKLISVKGEPATLIYDLQNLTPK